MKRIFLTILYFLIRLSAVSAQVDSICYNHPNLEILIPTGEMVNHFYVFRKASLTDTLAIKAIKAANTTFIGESAALYNYVQNYLFNLGIQKESEPPGLAITLREGCFGVMGYVLEENGKKVIKLNSGYVDIHKDMFSTDYDHLESITQLFPHEMGHVVQMYLCSDSVNPEPVSLSPNLHYFNLTTDYNTAFSEGFAEHFENISRKMEPCEKVKTGIFKDIDASRKTIPRYINGFNNDFRFPFRIGYYRAIAPLWFQQLENLKRYDLVETGEIKNVNSVIDGSGLANAILYRNTGVKQDPARLRNAAQAASTEGVISAFFSALALSQLGEKYLSDDFYRSFFAGPHSAGNSEFHIIPYENQYLKIFTVMHKYVKTNTTGRGQLYDFADGYCKEFPEESDEVLEILRETTGVSGIPESLPEIWILNKNVKYKYWVMAQFGLTIPYYVFNLNAADSLDLITFPGITGGDASKITGYRAQKGFYQKIEDIKDIPELSITAKTTLLSNNYDEKNVPSDSGRPDFMDLLYLPLPHLAAILFLWFIPVLIIFLYLIRNMDLTLLTRFRKAFLQLVKLFSFGMTGLICVALFSASWKVFIVAGLVIMGIKTIILRKNKAALKVSLIMTSIIAGVILYSVF
jgi:Helix-hairpin-helix motif